MNSTNNCDKPDNNDGLKPQDRVAKIYWALTRHLTRWETKTTKDWNATPRNLRISQESRW